MKITLLSDLHHEINYGFPQNFNLGTGDVLLLAGDVTCARLFKPHRTDHDAHTAQGLFRQLILNGLKDHDRILIIPGNHDYWGGGIHWGEVVPLMQDVCAGIDPRVSYTACDAFEHKGVHFLCTTLWTDFYGANASAMLAAGSWMNDYNYTTLAPQMYLTPEFILEEHVRQKTFLSESLDNLRDKKVVVMTHHAPSLQSIENFRKDHPATCAYYTALDGFIMDNPHIAAWCHGHTHYDVDYKIADTRVLSRQCGYVGYRDQPHRTYKTISPLSFEV